ncbi:MULTISPECIES: histidine phosphatase family protein [Dietzia]|jgi:probable phosphomutase (TIGR03848 family)|uniref:Histidine phosphatase family protein n=1 Tax=Dietzia maris TaxID=37915 RepID=A0ABT8GX20_9ACTN|nr:MULTISPECIES: histidine phosphatase family protein [Dietzia]MBB0991552.1 MSMEG_4193 family putative phosphomutase [Dietzia sp. SLG510A3-30A2]MBB0994267.1 MSMEG_4193 family putative phosphomutase [Dietzia sp. SLG510A3-40A3]MBB1010365.1 MSMEG_4193 family putative phosphomutase [Dietzia sp. SLG510A3-3B2-2]MDN4504758.1 histidine phosphatase family protein [Dietzia maris]MDV3355549.1 histidine phosphatase family protein [Dietzia sp. IN118]
MTVILLRHGRSTANTALTLAGRTPGVGLDDTGHAQAAELGRRLGELPVEAVVRSPLMRCRQTVEPLARSLGVEPLVDEGLVEVDYGSWTGRPLKDLASEHLWSVVQQHPSSAVFPDGESLAGMAGRAVTAIRRHDQRLADEADRDVLWVACSHGDVIKAVIADAYGMHLDQFQRIVVEPASVSVVRYTPHRPFVLRVNDTGGDLAGLRGDPAGRVGDATAGHGSSDAVPGGNVA